MTEGTDKRILIITGGNVDRDFAALWVKDNGFKSCIAVDRGAEAALALGLRIDLMIGDFDSTDDSVLERVRESEARVIALDPEKDATDTELALEAAKEGGAGIVYLLGATGERADHTFTTLMSIVKAKEEGLSVYSIDRYNKIYAVVSDICTGICADVCIERKKQHGDYVSLAVISDYADISLSGFKYGLENKRVYRGSSLCQSNEITGEEAHISVSGGSVLVFESKDGGCDV